jgi:hypothetical protein
MTCRPRTVSGIGAEVVSKTVISAVAARSSTRSGSAKYASPLCDAETK